MSHQAADAGLATRAAERAAEAAILEELELSASEASQLWRCLDFRWGEHWSNFPSPCASCDVVCIVRLQQRLKDGSYNPAWLAARRWRLTAGRFYSVRRVGKHSELAKSWLDHWWYRGQEKLNHKINRSHDFEDKALAKYRKQHGETVQQVGLFVHPELPWLGASPDGLHGSGRSPQHLIEIKSTRTLLGARSPAWHQVQGAMAVASAALGVPVHTCKLIDPAETYTVRFDEGWWAKYLQRLKKFYFGFFLPMAAKRILLKLQKTLT